MSEIDVTNCIYYQECIQFEDGEEIYHICNNDKNPTTYCQDSYNCYYKQLQQLKAENKKLKNKNNSIHSIADGLQQRNHNLTFENEELKNTINKLGIEHENYDNLIYWQMKEQQDKLKAENEELKKKHIIKNGHCEFFEGQTGLCRAKEFKRCNPINCKVFTLDSVSTILSLQAEKEELKARNSLGTLAFLEEDFKKEQKIEKYKQCLDEIEEVLVVDGCTKCPYGEDVVKKCKRNIEPCVLRLKGNILQLIKQAKEGNNG